MAKITLITGGCRSGKSAHAQALAESISGKRVFLATCPVLDDEMRQRIKLHQEARKRSQWETIEEWIDLPGALGQSKGFDVVLVDCLTLWVSNLMYQSEKDGLLFGEREMADRCGEVVRSARQLSGSVIFVTNEVGMGIVPENALARRYRDLIGRCNQTIAAAADNVTFVSCGIPLVLKAIK